MLSSSHAASSKRASRLVLPAVAAAAAALLLSSCAVGEADPAETDAALIRIVLPDEPPTLEGCESALTSTGRVIRSNITEPLIERDPVSGELQPLLATEWEATGDKEWTFTLREGVTFQDGTAFNAAAAAFAIDRTVNSDLECYVEGAYFGDNDLELEVVDDTTLKITTVESDPILPLRLSFVEIVSPETDATQKTREVIGTGPYAIKAWDAGLKLTLERNADYWGEAPAYEEAEYQWREEGTVRAAMVTSGEADLALGLGPDDQIGDLGIPYPNNETVALRMSGDMAPLDDIRVRQAINFALDRESIVDGLYPNLGQAAGQLIPAGVIGFTEDIKPWEFNLDKAKALIAEAKADGVAVDTKIILRVRNGHFPKVDQMGEVILEQLTQAGLNVEIQSGDSAQHHEYQFRPFVKDQGPIVILIQHGNQAGDALFTTGQLMKSDGTASTFGTAEFDAMLDKAATEYGDEREQAFADAFKYQNENIVQFANIVHMSGIIGKSASVNYTPNSASGDELRLSQITPVK